MIYLIDHDPYRAGRSLCDKHLLEAIKTAKRALIKGPENRTKSKSLSPPSLYRTVASLKWIASYGMGAAIERYRRTGKAAHAEWNFFLRAEKRFALGGGLIVSPSVIDKNRTFYLKGFTHSRWTRRRPPSWVGKERLRQMRAQKS